jgi:hypothetical protein
MALAKLKALLRAKALRIEELWKALGNWSAASAPRSGAITSATPAISGQGDPALARELS